MTLPPVPEAVAILILITVLPLWIAYYRELNKKVFAPVLSRIYWSLRKRYVNRKSGAR